MSCKSQSYSVFALFWSGECNYVGIPNDMSMYGMVWWLPEIHILVHGNPGAIRFRGPQPPIASGIFVLSGFTVTQTPRRIQ